MNTPRKTTLQRLNRLVRYGMVGVAAAAIHYGVLRGLGLILVEWLANPIAFLAASVAGFLGHALLTFREETGGQRFARRWLLLQYAVNLSVCGVLPVLLPAALGQNARDLVLVFTPTSMLVAPWIHGDNGGSSFSIHDLLHLFRCRRWGDCPLSDP